MMNFVNHGTDEAILKSMNAETPDEELVKAMNKQGLVQKDVQVRSKHGVFTRKQWVRTGEAKSTGSSKSTSKPEKSKKLIASAPDLTSEQIDKMKNRDVMDTLLSLSSAGDDGIATGKNPGDTYYMFNDTDGYSDAIHKTTVKAAEEGDPDVGKDMSAKEALKEICGCGKSPKKEAPKKLIASAPDLTSEEIDSMKIEDVYDVMNAMAGDDGDGIACGTKDNDTYYMFNDADDPEAMIHKTTVKAAVDGDPDAGKDMSIRAALKEICGY